MFDSGNGGNGGSRKEYDLINSALKWQALNKNKGSDDDKGGGGNPTTYQALTYSDNSGFDSYLSELRSMLDAEKAQREARANEKYKALISQADQNYDSSRNDIALNNARTNRWLTQQYGGTNSGQGLSNRLRANTNYNNNLNQALTDRNNAYQSALTDKYNDYAEATNNYTGQYMNMANNLYNAKLSSDLSKYQNAIDLDYKKYLKSLGY